MMEISPRGQENVANLSPLGKSCEICQVHENIL